MRHAILRYRSAQGAWRLVVRDYDDSDTHSISSCRIFDGLRNRCAPNWSTLRWPQRRQCVALCTYRVAKGRIYSRQGAPPQKEVTSALCLWQLAQEIQRR